MFLQKHTRSKFVNEIFSLHSPRPAWRLRVAGADFVNMKNTLAVGLSCNNGPEGMFLLGILDGCHWRKLMGCRLNYLSEINVLLGITLVWLVLHSQPEHRPLHQQILYSHNKWNQVTHLTCKTVGGNLRACQPILTLLVLRGEWSRVPCPSPTPAVRLVVVTQEDQQTGGEDRPAWREEW